MSRWILAQAAVLAAALLAGCGDRDEPRAPARTATPAGAPATRAQAAAPSADAVELDRLLSRRSAALARGDGRAYAATATGGQRARDRRAVRRARGLGVERVGLSVVSMRIGRRRARLRVRALYGLRGVTGRFGGERRLDTVRTRSGWRVARESSRRQRHPWEIGRFVRVRSRHFLVLAPAGLDVSSLPEALENGYVAMRDVLRGARLRRRYLVVVAGTTSQARQLTSGIRGIESLAAITDSRVQETGPARRAARVVSQRVLVLWPVFAELDPANRVRIVTHELTHAALSGRTSGRTPAWLVEGLALYTSGDRRITEAAEALRAVNRPSLRGLSGPDRIAHLSGAGQRDSYAYASASAYYIAERFGERAYLRLYESFNRTAIRGRAGDARTVDRAVRAALGISLRRLDRDLRAWIEASAAAP